MIGGSATSSSGVEAALRTAVELIVDETEKWGKVIKFAGIKPE
jgi:hypothetical protein